MKAREARDELRFLLNAPLSRLGFTQAGPLVFVQARGESRILLLFGLRRDPRGYFAAGASLGISFPKLVELIGGSDPDRIHINVPFHLVGDSRPFQEWLFSSPSELETAANELLALVMQRILPFADLNDTLEKVRLRLDSMDPRNWYILSPEKRTEILAATHWALGFEEEARQILERALSGLAGAPVKKRAGLESLRSKLHLASQ